MPIILDINTRTMVLKCTGSQQTEIQKVVFKQFNIYLYNYNNDNLMTIDE